MRLPALCRRRLDAGGSASVTGHPMSICCPATSDVSKRSKSRRTRRRSGQTSAGARDSSSHNVADIASNVWKPICLYFCLTYVTFTCSLLGQLPLLLMCLCFVCLCPPCHSLFSQYPTRNIAVRTQACWQCCCLWRASAGARRPSQPPPDFAAPEAVAAPARNAQRMGGSSASPAQASTIRDTDW